MAENLPDIIFDWLVVGVLTMMAVVIGIIICFLVLMMKREFFHD